MAKNDGGPAFPILVADNVMECQYQSGMTLRDYFAGIAWAAWDVRVAGTFSYR